MQTPFLKSMAKTMNWTLLHENAASRVGSFVAYQLPSYKY